MQKRRASTTRLRTEALVCKVSEKDDISAREKNSKKEEPQLRVCVPRHSVVKLAKKMTFRRESENRKKEVPLIRVCVPRHSVGGCSKKERTSNLLIKARNTLNFLHKYFTFHYTLFHC